MHILAFAASPRYGGNTEKLLDAVISGLRMEGASVEKFCLHEIDITPCCGCGTCELKFRCSIDDAFQDFIEPLRTCDGVVFATPLYFMNVPARGKAFIDRCQVFWSAQYRLGMNLYQHRRRLGLLISCGGARSGHSGTPLFRGLEDTINVLYDALGLEMIEGIFFKKIDRKGMISEMEDAIKEARERGRMMARLAGSFSE